MVPPVVIVILEIVTVAAPLALKIIKILGKK